MKTKPTKERLAKSESPETAVTEDGVRYRFTDGVLAQLYKRGTVTKAQFDAGDKFYTHYFMARISQERARSFHRERVDCEGGGEESDRVMHHRQMFNSAVKALDAGNVAFVCGVTLEDRPLEQLGGFTGYQSKKDRKIEALVLLKNGLDQLAEHFGITPKRRRHYSFIREGYDLEVREDMWESVNESS